MVWLPLLLSCKFMFMLNILDLIVFVFKGEQAKVEIPPFYPDRARPYLSETEAKTLFDKIDTICRDTGAPLYPLMLFPTALMIAPALVWGLDLPYAMQITIGAIVTIVVSIFGIVGTFLILGYKRKAQVTTLIEEWNKTEGVPKGLFIELGDNRGPSAENFWKSVYPRRFTISNGQQDTIVIDNNNE